MTTSTSAQNFIQISSVVFEIGPGEVKSGGAFMQAGAFIWQNTSFSEDPHQQQAKWSQFQF